MLANTFLTTAGWTSTNRKGAFCGPRNTAAMQQHLIHQHLASVFHSQCYHSQAITDENHIHASHVGNMAARKVVSSQDGDWLTLLVHVVDGLYRHLLSGFGGRGAHWRVGAVSDGGEGAW